MESFSDDEKFEVDHIAGQRKRKGVLEYLVHWKGSGDSVDTWEPAKTIAADCTQAIKSFLEAQKSQKRSKSRSKSRSRSSSRSRKAATTAGKSSRSRSRGRQEKQKATPEIKQTATPEIKQTEQKEETKIIRRSLRQKAATEPETPEVKVDEKETNEINATASSSLKSTLTMSTTTKSSVKVEESDDTPRRNLRSSTIEQREKLEVQRVHNEQRPVREDDSKPRSPIWKVADYIVIVLFIISLFAAIFLFLEKFVDLENFKKQAFPNLGVLKDRLAGARLRFVELGSSVMGHISDTWLYIVEQVKRPDIVVNEKAVPK